MRVRISVGLSIVSALLLLLLPGSALACNEPSIFATPSTASPGTTVSWSIANLDPGASYTVSGPDGSLVASGTASGAGEAGSFTMPDLGADPKTVYVVLDGVHEGTDYPDSAKIQYAPPAPSPAPSHPADKPAPAPPAAIGGAPRGADRTTATQRVREAATRDRQAAGGGPAPSPSFGGLVGSEPGPRSPNSSIEASAGSSSKAASSETRDRVFEAATATTQVGPARVPRLALGVAALIFVLGTALAAFLVYLLRSGPDPKAAIRSPAPLGRDPVEAELQEIIADEMARGLLADLNLTDASGTLTRDRSEG